MSRARLQARHSNARIAVIDKEPGPGYHQSGRNSGVVTADRYYPEGSLKARTCVEGTREMRAYCEERGLPLIVPAFEADGPQLDMFLNRSRADGVRVEPIDEAQLQPVVALRRFGSSGLAGWPREARTWNRLFSMTKRTLNASSKRRECGGPRRTQTA